MAGRWLADWAHLVTLAGLASTVWGISLAWTAAVNDYRTFAGRPVFPRLTALTAWFRRHVLRQRREVVVLGGMANATLSATGTLTATGEVGLPPDATPEQQFEYVRERLAGLQGELYRLDRSVGETERRLSQEISQIHAESQRRDDELQESVRRVATGSVKRELKGLLLVGIGSLLTAIPSLFG
ncbi:hypothetical protein DQ237_14285 [Blastococcus sp. TF02-8]|uniref:hypothetical protein n=1 Tax=Blastococcus sp. TF02-8 TaxID=2250574 RepID=UPI000DEB1892|nr:hypothetical protein [Blastococcus sp. TF02-8]RBY95248.1 hypothetical protein DQ237_14285 [Blastococcus sp. TF02-8]